MLPALPRIEITPHMVILWLRRPLGVYMFWLVFHPFQLGGEYPFFLHGPFILLAVYWIFARHLHLGWDASLMAGALLLALMPPVLGYVSMPITMLRPFYAGYMGPVTDLCPTMDAGAAAGMWLRLVALLGVIPLGWSMIRQWGAARGGLAAAVTILAVGAIVTCSLLAIPLVFVASAESPGDLYWAGAGIEWAVTLTNQGEDPVEIEGLVVEKAPMLTLDLAHSGPTVRRVVAVTSNLCLLEWERPVILEPGGEHPVSLLLVPLEGGDYELTARVQCSGRISLPAEPFSFQVLEGTSGRR